MFTKLELVFRLMFSLAMWKWFFRFLEFYYKHNAAAINRLGQLGKGTWVEPTAKLTDPEHIFFGEQCHVNHLTCWQPGSARIRVGDRLLCGPGTMLFASNYRLDAQRLRDDPQQSGDITIGNDVWLGAGVVVTAGVTIGDGAVIGAGAVVTKDIPPHAVAAGIPARVVAQRPASQASTADEKQPSHLETTE